MSNPASPALGKTERDAVRDSIKNIKSLIGDWDEYNRDINTMLNDPDIGVPFQEGFYIGKVSTEIVTGLTQILYELSSEEMYTLCSQTNEFVDEQEALANQGSNP